jgi:hypothetical protein
MKKLMSTISWSLGLIFLSLLLLLCCASLIMLPFLIGRFIQAKPVDQATQLDRATIDDLCRELALPPGDERCQPEAEVNIFDFVPAFKEHFKFGVATYKDVAKALGEYEDNCEPRVTTSDGYSYFRCWYEFNDSLYPVVFRFSGEENTLDQIKVSTGG